MKFPDWLKVYGDVTYRGNCPDESLEQMSFFNRLRQEYPDTFGAVAIHPRNEGLKEKGQFSTVLKHKAEGMTKGASDVIIPGRRCFVCEIKRRDHTKSRWQDGQQEYLMASHELGAVVCVALGAAACWQAFEEWREENYGR